MKEKLQKCSFCEKTEDEVVVLVVRDDVGICDVCVEMSRDVVGRHRMFLLEKKLKFPAKPKPPELEGEKE